MRRVGFILLVLVAAVTLFYDSVPMRAARTLADTKISALTGASAAAGANEFAINEAGTSKKLTGTQLAAFMWADSQFTGTPDAPTAAAGLNNTQIATTAYADRFFMRAAATTVAAGPYTTWLTLAANSSAITNTTLTAVMTITSVGAGNYYFKCQLIWQTTVAASVGVDVAVQHTGTLTAFGVEHRFSSTGGAAATAAASQIAAAATGNLYESQGSRTKNTIIGAGSVSADTNSLDMISTLEGYFVVSVSGDLQILLTNETATGSPSLTARIGSFLELKKLS